MAGESKSSLLGEITELSGDCDILAARVFDAPRELVFSLWTDPKHLERWWGPNGFTTTTVDHSLKPGGGWRLVMHGPDGRDYHNEITYSEIVPNEKLVYKHGGDLDVEPINFEVVVTFESLGPKQTRITMRMHFANPDARTHVIKTYGAFEGLKETLGRLKQMVEQSTAPDRPFVFSRTFKAPRELVWKAWTERERLMQWFGPKGFRMTTAKMDFRPGGSFLYELRSASGQSMWGKWVFREITPPERFVLIHSFSDAQGGVTTHPMAPTWPRETFSTTTFTEKDGETTVTIEWTPHNVSDLEINTFDEGRSGMTIGWGGTFDQLDEYLAQTKS